MEELRNAPRSERENAMQVMGIWLDDITPGEILEKVWQTLDNRSRLRIINANAYMLNLAWRHPWIRELFDWSEIAFFDGVGAQFAAFILFGRMPHRTTPPEWIDQIAAGLSARGGSMYVLGGAPDVLHRAVANLEAKYGRIVAGSHHGYFDHRSASDDSRQLVAEINRLKPDVLLLNLGMPLQERWLYDHWEEIDTPVAITAGALVDHLAGRVRRPPMWVANLGLEWLVRLAVEPRRLWRRYILGLPVFLFRLARQRIWPTTWDALR
jgi:N-acetylglucosaminyldiphosphoundecaprenol N-acetyl-beta-D-mannosaminyltransferase